MKLQNNKRRCFVIEDDVTVSQLTQAGCVITFSNTEKLPDGVLVIPLRHLDIRAEHDGKHGVWNEHHAMIGFTRSTGGSRPVRSGNVETPFRDGAHAGWDSESLRDIPIYAVCENDVRLIPNKKEAA